MNNYWAQRRLRADRAKAALERLHACQPEYRQQAYTEWLEVATAAEVRKHHRDWMGVFPQWAEREVAHDVV